MRSSSFTPRYRANVLSTIKNHLFSGADKYYQEEILKIAKLHAEKQKTCVNGFRYKGKRYHAVSNILTPQLDPSLRERMDKVLAEQEALSWFELPKITNMIQYGLRLCDNDRDILTLFPIEITQILGLHQAGDERITVTEEACKAFNEKFQEEFELVRKRIVANLVLS